MMIATTARSPWRLNPLPQLWARIASGCLLWGLLSTGVAHGESPPDGLLETRVAPLYRQDLQPLTAASCAAASCHGGPRPGISDPSAAGRSAYPLWLGRDPHARSWQTLCSPESIAIMTRLGILDGDRIRDQAGWDNCLACHNTYRSEPVVKVPPGRLPEPSVTPARSTFTPRHTEGIGCAACHGPAERWIGQHFLAGWQGENASDQGFVANDDILTRARMCASCHVGAHDRDMNHDLIAAGHPVLRFEMASYHSRLPKHWRDPGAEDRAAFESKLWSAGAIASADAWLALQQGRAERMTAVSIWPELASHDCSSCHQALRLNSARDPLTDPGHRGTAKLARWDLAPVMLWAHAELASRERATATAAAELLSRLDSVRQTLEAGPTASRDNLASAIGMARRQLASSFAKTSQPLTAPHHGFAQRPLDTDLLHLFVRAAGDTEATQTWESAAQVYLLLAASQYQWPGAVASELQTQAQRMRLGLALPEGLDSPRYLLSVPTGPEITRDELRQLLQRIMVTLETEVESLPPPVAASPQRSDLTRSKILPALLKDASHVGVH